MKPPATLKMLLNLPIKIITKTFDENVPQDQRVDLQRKAENLSSV